MQTDESSVDIFMINIYKYFIRIDTKITKFQPYEHPLTLDHEAVIFWMGNLVLKLVWHLLFFKEFAQRATFFMLISKFHFAPPGPLCPTFPYIDNKIEKKRNRSRNGKGEGEYMYNTGGGG